MLYKIIGRHYYSKMITGIDDDVFLKIYKNKNGPIVSTGVYAATEKRNCVCLIYVNLLVFSPL